MTTYRQGTKEVLNLLEDLEKKLNKHKPFYPSENDNYNFSNNQFNYNPVNSNNYSEMGNQYNLDKITPSMEFNIRKLIKEEFNTLILPYQEEMHSGLNIMDSKIDKNSNEIKDLKLKNLNNLNNIIANDNLGFSFNQPKQYDNNQYVLRVEYENKINELEIQISTLNTYSKTLKEAFDNKVVGTDNYLGKDEFGLKMNEIQNQFDSIISDIKQIKNNMNNFNQSLNEIKINNNKIKNDLLIEIQNIKNDFANKMDNMNNNYNSINGIIKNQSNNNDLNEQILNVTSNLNNLKNEFNVFTKQLDINFINSLKTIVNQHVSIAELNVVKNTISGCENNINQILNKNKNYDTNISNIQNNITSLENKISNINLNNINNSDIGEFAKNNKKNMNLNDNQLNILNELQKIDLNKFLNFDFNIIDEIKDEIKNNNENLTLMKTNINELDTELQKLKQKLDFDSSIKDFKNSIININDRINKLEKNQWKKSQIVDVEISNVGEEKEDTKENKNAKRFNLKDESTNKNNLQKNPFNNPYNEDDLEEDRSRNDNEKEEDKENIPRGNPQRSDMFMPNEEEKKQNDENQNNNKEKENNNNTNNNRKSKDGNDDEDFSIGDDLIID